MKKSLFFLAILFLIGLIMLPAYGAHLDQEPELEIMYMNIRSYLEAFDATDTEAYRLIVSKGVIAIADSIEQDHGMSVYYPVSWLLFLNEVSPFIGNLILHAYTYAWAFAGIIALFFLLKEMFGEKVAMITTALCFFTPRIFAEIHYNNIDILLFSLTSMLFYVGWKLLHDVKWRYVVLFALFGALSTNMRIINMFIWGLVGLYIILYYVINKKLTKDIFFKILSCIFLWIVFFVIITPATWEGVIDYFVYVLSSAVNYNWNDYILFEGNMYNRLYTGMPRRYLPKILLLTLPVGITALAVIGAFVLLFRLWKREKEHTAKYLYIVIMILCGAIPAVYAILSATPIYNGWRHFYFAYVSILMLVALGVKGILQLAEKHQRVKACKLVFVGYIAVLFIGIVINHPYQYAYYNIFAGDNIEETYELDHWDMSFKQALEFLADEDSSQNIKIGTVNIPSMWGITSQLPAIRGKERMRFEVCENWADATYVIINTTYANMYGTGDYAKIQEDYELIHEIKSYGNVICEVYAK